MIILMRHAESPVNVTQTLSCRRVDPPLTESGVKQAEQAAAWLAGRPIQRIYASPLLRALGLHGRQIAASVVLEAGLLAAITGVLAIPMGVFNNYTNTRGASMFWRRCGMSERQALQVK